MATRNQPRLTDADRRLAEYALKARGLYVYVAAFDLPQEPTAVWSHNGQLVRPLAPWPRRGLL